MIKRKIFIAACILVICLVCVLFIVSIDRYKAEIRARGFGGAKRIKNAENNDIIRVYKADDEIVQIVTTEGYNGKITILVSIKDDKVRFVDILHHSETPDYAGYIEEDWFLNRLCLSTSKKLNTVKIKRVNDNDVVAVTGATISSSAVVDGVNLCIENYGGLKDE